MIVIDYNPLNKLGIHAIVLPHCRIKTIIT